jgi:arginyl-tRNA synthetase
MVETQMLIYCKYPIPFIVAKSDGGYNYDTTHLAAIKHRHLTLKVDRIIYIAGLGQREHFEMEIGQPKK